MKELAGNVSQRTDILNCVLKGREMHFQRFGILHSRTSCGGGSWRGEGGALSDQKDCIQGVAVLLAKLT